MGARNCSRTMSLPFSNSADSARSWSNVSMPCARLQHSDRACLLRLFAIELPSNGLKVRGHFREAHSHLQALILFGLAQRDFGAVSIGDLLHDSEAETASLHARTR